MGTGAIIIADLDADRRFETTVRTTACPCPFPATLWTADGKLSEVPRRIVPSELLPVGPQ